jgi:hypothetical protein
MIVTAEFQASERHKNYNVKQQTSPFAPSPTNLRVRGKRRPLFWKGRGRVGGDGPKKPTLVSFPARNVRSTDPCNSYRNTFLSGIKKCKNKNSRGDSCVDHTAVERVKKVILINKQGKIKNETAEFDFNPD